MRVGMEKAIREMESLSSEGKLALFVYSSKAEGKLGHGSKTATQRMLRWHTNYLKQI